MLSLMKTLRSPQQVKIIEDIRLVKYGHTCSLGDQHRLQLPFDHSTLRVGLVMIDVPPYELVF